MEDKTNEQTPDRAGPATVISAINSDLPGEMRLSPQTDGGSCPTCAGAAKSQEGGNGSPPAYIYALGRIQARFPNQSVEREFAQANAQIGAKLTNPEVFHAALSQRENRYLARQLCWVLMIEGIETYILIPRDPADVDLLVEAIRPVPNPGDVDIVIGVRGPMAPATMCNGLVVPIVVFDKIYSFNRPSLIKSVPRPASISEKDDKNFRATAETLFDRIMQMADNAGATDEHRGLNYLALRCPSIYEQTCKCHAENRSLESIETRPSRLSGTRKILDAVLSFRHRQNDVVEKYFVRVDVSEEFPFLVTKLQPYYDR